MAGIGSEAVGGLSALQASLRQRIADQIAQQERDRLAQQQTFQNDLAARRMAMDEDTHRATQERLLRQERDTAAGKVPLTIGDTVDPSAFDRTFKDTSSEALFTPQTTLPATQIGGGATIGQLRGRRIDQTGDVSPLDGETSSGVATRTAAPRVITGRLVYAGTPAQRTDAEQKAAAARLIANFPEGSRERLALEYEDATGKSAPAGMFEPKPAHVGEGNFTLPGVGPIVGLKNPDGRITYRGQDVTDQVTPYVPPPTASTTDNRLDRSYQYHRSALDKLSTPLEQQADRMARLAESVNQATPQADALIAPELLTAMAGGQGSGLRMNEAEIARIVGGRSRWESLKASLNQWATDPSKANSITPDQRQQIRVLLGVVRQRTQRKIEALNHAGDALIDATDVSAHRRIVADTRRQLQQLDSTTIAASGTAGSGDTVRMRAPNGQETDVPADQVEHFKARGAVVVR